MPPHGQDIQLPPTRRADRSSSGPVRRPAPATPSGRSCASPALRASSPWVSPTSAPARRASARRAERRGDAGRLVGGGGGHERDRFRGQPSTALDRTVTASTLPFTGPTPGDPARDRAERHARPAHARG